MDLRIEGLSDGAWIPERLAFAVPNAETHMQLGSNLNPEIAWQNVPAGTRTLVLLCYDDDVPARPDDVNQEGRTIPRDFPRTRFYHWVVVDLPPGAERIREGSACNGVTPRGKQESVGPMGSRQGLNTYTDFLAGDAEMAGKYYGYDGPCPPWNDERLHHYRFELFATDFDKCPVEGAFTGAEVESALQGHILGSAQVTGVYSLYPPLLEKR